MPSLAVLLLFVSTSSFVVDASSEAMYNVSIPHLRLRSYVDDIGLLARNMPGVLGVQSLGDNRFLYQTEKNIPLAPPFRTDFIIRKTLLGDTVTVYRSEDIHDPNYMSCKVRLHPLDEATTSITISLRVRLTRTDPGEVHWLAPIVGEDFISDRMQKDLDEMLKTFIVRSNQELYNSDLRFTVSR